MPVAMLTGPRAADMLTRMESLAKVLRWAGVATVWVVAVGATGLFLLVTWASFTDPLPQPNSYVPVIAGIVASLAAWLVVRTQWRSGKAARRTASIGVTLTLVTSVFGHVAAQKPCNKLRELEQACARGSQCAELQAYRDQLHDAVCRAKPMLCRYSNHDEPDFTRYDVTYDLACLGQGCRKDARRCKGSVLETCDYPHGTWTQTPCEHGCGYDQFGGPARCTVVF